MTLYRLLCVQDQQTSMLCLYIILLDNLYCAVVSRSGLLVCSLLSGHW